MSKLSFMAGVLSGMAVGVGAGMLVNSMDSSDMKKLKKSAGRMFTTIGAVADHMLDMYR